MKYFTYLLLSLLVVTSCKKQETNDAATENSATEATAENYSYSDAATKLTWTAFKTPDKVGVPGTFKEIEVTNTQASENAEKVLEGAQFSINTSSVDTGDPTRDPKIVSFFFGNVLGDEITGSFGAFENGTVPVTLKINDIEKTMDMSYTLEGDEMNITGKIDVIEDFSASKALEAINEACYELHQGKTWSDVDISVRTVFLK